MTRNRADRPYRLDFARMAHARRVRQLTQQGLADRAGCSKQTVWRVETGKQDPTVSQLVAFARALGVPVHLLFDVVAK